MNDHDKEAFEKWWDEIRLRGQSTFGIVAITWQAACEYKQKEIDDLKNVTYWSVEQNGKVTRHISIAEVEKLQADNRNLQAQVQELIKSRDELREENNRLITRIAHE